MTSPDSSPAMPVCPNCRGGLDRGENELSCPRCSLFFKRNSSGYFEFRTPGTDPAVYDIDVTAEGYAREQETCGPRVYREYLKPLLKGEAFRRVLDAGCGTGREVSMFLDDGCDAYGIDLPALSRFWPRYGNSPERFFCCDASSLPFPDDFFDVVYSLGVIEHIGTRIGHCTLAGDYREARRRYASELLRVARPGGRIIVACPNKHFPVDIQHGPTDAASPVTAGGRIRDFICRTTKLNVHPVWGKYHLLSHGEVKKLFCGDCGARSFEPLPAKNYFAFGRFKTGFLKPFAGLARRCVNHLPRALRATCLNPYVIALIRK
ncbi:MAG: class I SAM-dependent methyltransferase [bacterium]